MEVPCAGDEYGLCHGRKIREAAISGAVVGPDAAAHRVAAKGKRKQEESEEEWAGSVVGLNYGPRLASKNRGTERSNARAAWLASMRSPRLEIE